MNCQKCPKYRCCSTPCRQAERYLRMFDIYKSNWKGHGPFKTERELKRSLKYDFTPKEDYMKVGIRCPVCGKMVSYYRKKSKLYVCGKCAWEGNSPVFPKKEEK